MCLNLPKGDCYEAAHKSCSELNSIKDTNPTLKNNDIYIVQGYITAPNGPYKGKCLKHAWVECGGNVYETSNGQLERFTTA